MAKKPTSEQRPRAGTLGWLAEKYFKEGRSEALKALRQAVPPRDDVEVWPATRREQVRRATVRTDEGIVYIAKGPPSHFDAPYTLVIAEFSERAGTGPFMFHSGEEIAVSLVGQLKFEFWGSAPGNGMPRQLLHNLDPSAALRINPSIPHRVGPVHKTGATAWIAMRPSNDAPVSITFDPSLSERSETGRLEQDDVADPGKYALASWRLAERVLLARQSGGIRVNELASACGVHPSYVSRIESADINVPLDTLFRIAKLLRIRILDLIAPEPWIYFEQRKELEHFPDEPTKLRSLIDPPPGADPLQHHLHPLWLSLTTGQTWEGKPDKAYSKLRDSSTEVFASWIVVRGEAIAEIGSPSEIHSRHLIQKGDVLHCRHPSLPASINALEDTEIAVIFHSAHCPCSSAMASSTDHSARPQTPTTRRRARRGP